MSRIVLQKLLHRGMSAIVLDRGYDQVGGYVVEASAAAELRTPEALRAAYGIADDADPWVDVVRFLTPACAELNAPSGAERPWPAYPQGFLHPVAEPIVPVWTLSTTRYSPGAEVWRISADGTQKMMSSYGGAARGWSGARQWRPASRYFGTRAVWRGTEYAADVADGAVSLTSFTELEHDGWSQQRPATWSRVVEVAECEVYELDFRASLQGVDVRVLEVIGSDLRLEIVGDDPAIAEQLHASMIDFGQFELVGVPGALLTQTELVARARRDEP
ncbi:hypothetical protein AB1K54_16040 [Microbacterium sp. BWT-B31]|uniref:hypothetical protein n=1 Tax=Microbacterium sp. BWT-B31 TaxID=3232072 RepID=UPI0035299294